MNYFRSFGILTCILGAVFTFGCGAGSSTNTATNTNANANKANSAANTSSNSSSNSSASNSASNSSAQSNTKTGSASNEDLDFTLVNKTGYAIKKVYVGQASTADWDENEEILKGRSFPDGATMEVKFHPKATAPIWDLKVDWADGSPSDEWLKLDLTKIEKLTLKYDRAKDVTTAEIE
jgi:hypothetical protein